MFILYHYWVLLDLLSEIWKWHWSRKWFRWRWYSLNFERNNSKFVTHELSPCIHWIEDFSKGVYTRDDLEGTLQIEYDDISMKTGLILTRFVGTFCTLRFDERSFFKTFLGFAPYCDYKPTNLIHADSPGVYTSEKIQNFSTIDKIHMKCDVIDGSAVNGLKQPRLFSFVLDKPSGYKQFCEPETIQYKKKQICFEFYNVSFWKW